MSAGTDVPVAEALLGLAAARPAPSVLREALEDAVNLQNANYGDATGTHLALLSWIPRAKAVLASTAPADAGEVK